MAYTPIGWLNDQAPAINKSNLNHMDNEIARISPEADEAVDIRIGTMGEEYPTAGDMVRKEIQAEKSISNMLSDYINQKNEENETGVKTIIPILTKGTYGTSGYNRSTTGSRYLVTQVFEPGVYNFTPPEGTQFQYTWYVSDSQGTAYRNFTPSVFTGLWMPNRFVITIRHATNPASTNFYADAIESMVTSNMIQKLLGIDGTKQYVTRITDNHKRIVEFYLIDQTYKPLGIVVKSGSYRMRLKDSNNQTVVNGLDIGSEYYSDKIHTFIDPNNGKLVGYYILHYAGDEFSEDNGNAEFTDFAKDLNYSPRIKEYLNRNENIVLFGDSLFGYGNDNPLRDLLISISNKKVYNCGFGGCRMSWRTSDGSNAYDNFSFVSVVDAVISGDYSGLDANKELVNGYVYRIADLKNVDWTKPTTLLVCYVNNDITGNVPIGDLWKYTDTDADFDKESLLGAFNYGMKKLIGEHPNVNIIEFTSMFRRLGPNDLPPYLYKNDLNLSALDYDNAIKENAERNGIAIYDMFHNAGRNWYNTDYYQQDTSHYNEKGFKLFAKILNAIDKSFIN